VASARVTAGRDRRTLPLRDITHPVLSDRPRSNLYMVRPLLAPQGAAKG
jgi:hypothetical protein